MSEKTRAMLIAAAGVAILIAILIAIGTYKKEQLKKAIPSSKHITVELVCVEGNAYTLDGKSVRLGDYRHPDRMACE